MILKNKDGSVYILNEPNPLVKNQRSFDANKLIFHNFKWEDIIYSNAIQKSYPQKQEASKEEKKVKTEEKIQIEQQINENKESFNDEEMAYKMPLIKHKVLSYCLPAITKNYKDNLYGESWSKLKYGKKFIFPFVMIENQDLTIQFWTSDPNQQITENSIVYPFSYEIYNSNTNSYDRVPYDEYRWWEISKKEIKNGGWIFEAIPSKNQPDFSD
jgi:hypothetical protein